MFKKLRAAIIGTGMIANAAHLPALDNLRRKGLVEIVACADIRPEAAAETAKRHDIPAWYSDPQKMLDEQKPDFVAVCTPNNHHKEWTIAALKAGANVACEKPMAVSLAAAQEIAHAAQSHGIEAMINWPTTWRPYIHKLKAALDQGVCGKLLKLSYINGHTGPLGVGASHRGVDALAEVMTDEERARTWWYRKSQGGGAFLDIGCYGCMYSAWFQREEALFVSAAKANLNTPYCDDCDNLAALIEYPHALSVIEGTWTIPSKALPTGPVLCCERGVIYCTTARDVEAMDLFGNPVPVPEAPGTPYKNICEQYMAHRTRGVPLDITVTLSQNLKMMALLDTAMKAAETGKKERVPCLN